MAAWWVLTLLPAYVDPMACAGCHRQIWETYRRTGMARSFSPPRLETPAAYYHPASDRRYVLSQRDGRYFLSRDNVLEKEVHYVLGSGNHATGLLHRDPDGTLRQLPLAWYSENGGFWAMAPGYDRPDHLDFRRRVTGDCLFCHNGYPRDGKLAEGIDCQRCHGPGSEHAADPGRARLVNPARLSRDRQLEVCLQCHLETTSFRLPYAVRRFGREVFSYRPGEPLADYMLHFDHAPSSGYADKFEVAGAPYRLMQSACFRKSGTMTCTTCHHPHDIPRGEAAARHYAAACRTCHQASHHPSEECRPCHMPRRRTDDGIHVVMTDHRIQRRLPARDVLAPRAEFHDDLGKGYTGEVVPYYPARLDSQLYLAVAQVTDGANLRAGIPRLRRALARYRPAEGEFYYEMAEAYRKIGRYAEAVPFYEECLRRKPGFLPAIRASRSVAVLSQAPGDARSQNNLGEILLQQDRVADAIAALRRAIALDPDLPEAHNNLGVALSRRNDFPGAQKSLEEALRIEPALAEAHLNLGVVLLAQGQKDRARYHLQRAAERGNRKAQNLLQ